MNPYKSVTALFILLSGCTVALQVGCKKKKEESTPVIPNPSGTITLQVRSAGNGTNTVYISTGGAISTSSIQCATSHVFNLDSSNNWQGNSANHGCVGPFVAFATKFVDVGAVSGLGAVVSSGSGTPQQTVSATSGHGFVISGAVGTSSTQKYRMYVTREIICVNSFGVDFVCGREINIAPGP